MSVIFNEFTFPEELSICPHNSADWSNISLVHLSDDVMIRYHCGTTVHVTHAGENAINQSDSCMRDEIRVLRDANIPEIRRELHTANDRATLAESQAVALQDQIHDLQGKVAELEGAAHRATGFQVAFDTPVAKEGV